MSSQSTRVCRVLLVHIIMKLFFRFAQAWPKGIQAAGGRTRGPAASLLCLPGRPPQNQYRPESGFPEGDGSIILVPNTASEAGQLGEGWQKGLPCKALEEE